MHKHEPQSWNECIFEFVVWCYIIFAVSFGPNYIAFVTLMTF